MSHVDDVKFVADEYYVFRGDDADGWGFRFAEDGSIAASGPCPICRGESWGPELSEIVVPPTKAMPGEEVDVPCKCRCGHDHGGGREQGCGRWWIASGVAAR